MDEMGRVKEVWAEKERKQEVVSVKVRRVKVRRVFMAGSYGRV